MGDELFPLSALDQPLQTDNKWLLSRIEEIIDQSVSERKSAIALEAVRNLYGIAKVTGLGLAKLLYLTNKNWDTYSDVNDNFEDVIHAEIGLHRDTTDRYVSVWNMFANHDVPEDLLEPIQQRNIKDLIPIAKTLEQGYQIERDEWEGLAEATDFNEVSAITRDIKGKPPRKSALQILMDKDGTLTAVKGGNLGYVGFLNVDEENEIALQAIERIIRSGGILKK